jgi:hypothetical protein
MARRQVHAGRVRLGDGNRVALGEPRERGDGRAVAAEVRGHEQRQLGRREPPGERLEMPRARHRRRDFGGRQRAPRRTVFAREHLARQREVHGSARRRERDVERASEHLVDGLSGAQLVVPLRVLAHDAGLIEVLLAPVDRRVARRDVAALRDRRAAGHQEQRHVVAVRVHQRADRVAGADRDVNDDRRRLAGGEVVAVRHRDREVLVRNGQELRQRLAALRERHERLDQRREIGAGVREHVLDAARFERAQQRLGDGALLSRRVVHQCVIA